MEFKILAVGPKGELWEYFWNAFLDQGYELGWVHSSGEALEILSRISLDLLVVDLDFLDLSGPEVIRAAKGGKIPTKILVISAYPERQQDAHSLGVDRFLRKPLTVQKLAESMHALLAEKGKEEFTQSIEILPDVKTTKPLPTARILLIEFDIGLAQILLQFLREPHRSKGAYSVSRTTLVSWALSFLEDLKPDFVLMNLFGIGEQSQLIQELRALKVQPKDYIFYMGSRYQIEKIQATLPGKLWMGDPWTEKGLQSFGKLVGKTALRNGLILH